MLPTLDPIELLRDGLRRSRLLRVTAIVGVVSLLWLLGIVGMGRVALPVAGLLVLLNFGVWYFALATSEAFHEYRRWARSPLSEGLAASVDLVAMLAIGVCQGLFLIMVMKLASNSAS